MTHPHLHDLLDHLFGAPAMNRSAVGRHLQSCAECTLEASWLAHIAAVVRADNDPGAQTPECLDDATTAALAEGSLAGAARAASLRHVATCSHCRTTVASVGRALAVPAVAREAAMAERAGHRRWYRVAVPAAAAAALLLLAWPPRPTDERSAHRAPAAMRAAAPSLMSPIGEVPAAGILRWTSVAEADRYRVTLFDLGGKVLYEVQVADTLATLPDSIHIVPGNSYIWKVEARTGWDRWATSEIADFTVVRGVPQ